MDGLNRLGWFMSQPAQKFLVSVHDCNVAEKVLYQGTTSVVPIMVIIQWALAPERHILTAYSKS